MNEAYKELIPLLDKKHDLLVEVKMSDLEALLKEETKLTTKIAKLEKERREVFTQLAAKEESVRPDMKLAEVIAVAPTSLRGALAKIHAELKEISEQAKNKSEINSVLATGALDAVNVRLNKIGKAAVSPTYGNGGTQQVTHEKKFDFNA